ncbi:MAG TPA: hypothetical protein VGF70_05400 [Solirubrobacteraceae bacterium]|jgi:hypothetical protein
MRSRALALLVLCSPALALAGCGNSSKSSGTTSTTSTQTTAAATGGPTQAGGGTMGPEGIPIEQGPSLAPASTTSTSRKVDGVQCAPIEQLAYHIHAHLQVYYNGSPRQLPGAIGMLGPVAQQSKFGPFYGATQCYYWLHTHTADGVIHIESPTATFYTLGDFFDEWGQPLSANHVATAQGPVTAFVNGKRWTKSPRQIQLKPHTVIQLDVGKPVAPFHNVSFGRTGL